MKGLVAILISCTRQTLLKVVKLNNELCTVPPGLSALNSEHCI